MLFPIKHENMTARRWPLITIGLILLNLVFFLGTHTAMENQEAPLLSVKASILVLAAQHPNLTIPHEAHQFVADFRRYYPTKWEELQSPDDKAGDGLSRRMTKGNCRRRWTLLRPSIPN